MVNIVLLLVAFAVAFFLFFNGPRWLVTSAGVSAKRKETPKWLDVAERSFSRLGGLVILGCWSWVATAGSLLAASLLMAVCLVGVFILLNGPIWVITRSGAFARGRQAPRWLEIGLLWFHRAIGSAAILSGFLLGIRYMLIASRF